MQVLTANGTLNNSRRLLAGELDESAIDELLLYAELLSRRGLISCTLGNIAIRRVHPRFGSVVYTKRRGASLEEMTRDDIIVTGLDSDELYYGEKIPGTGNIMSRGLMALRPDVNAVIHSHADIVIAYFSQHEGNDMKMLSIDTALVLGTPPSILPREENVEIDADLVVRRGKDTNCIVMPNHGLTTVGRSLSEAYHRHTVFVSEVQRLYWAELLARHRGKPVQYVDDAITNGLYPLADDILYGWPRKG